MAFTLTKEEIKQEILRCGRDPVYFITNYCKVSHPLRGLLPFKLFPFQEQLVRDYRNNRFNIVLKARQLGISTTTSAYVAWMSLFFRGKTTLILATKLKTSENLLKKVKLIFKHLPDWLLISKVKTDNATSFELDNGSVIIASAKSSDAGRSEALSLLVVDEAAHVEGLDELWAAIWPTLSTGGSCMLISSPNGVGNHYHQIWQAGELGQNDFKTTKLMWYVHPERDEEWFKNETKSMSKRLIAQELMCDFLMSGETVFDPEDIARIAKSITDPVRRAGIDRNYWVWKGYESGSSYLLSSDVSRGDGKDYSVFHVICLETMEIVAEYQGRLTPDLFSHVILQAAGEYGNCLVVVENNSVGFAVLEKLEAAAYPNIYYSVKGTHEYIDQYEAEQRGGTVAGFSTTSKTRPLIVAKAEEYIRNNKVKIHSKRLLNECKTFVWDNGRPVAMRGYCDDLIMAFAIACWVRDVALDANTRDMAYRKAFLDSIVKVTQKIDTSVVGQAGHMAPTTKEIKKQAGKDFMWIYKK